MVCLPDSGSTSCSLWNYRHRVRYRKRRKKERKKSHDSFSCKGKDSVLVERVWVQTTQAAVPCVGGNREDSLSVSGLLQFTDLQLLNHCYHILISTQLGYNRKHLVSFGYIQGSWHRFQTFQVNARLSPQEQMTDIVSKHKSKKRKEKRNGFV